MSVNEGIGLLLFICFLVGVILTIVSYAIAILFRSAVRCVQKRKS